MKIDSVSDTALWVATFRARESKRPDALFRDVLAERLIGKKGPAIARDMGHQGVMEWVLVVRTVAIDQLILQNLKDVSIVLNIGAGLDTRPYRLDLPADLTWIEADFPAIIDYKNELLASETPRCRLKRVIVDLGDRAKAMEFYRAVANEAGSGKVLLITEGVLPYLPPESVSQLVKDLHGFVPFHYWIMDYSNQDQRRMPKAWKAKLGDNYFKFSSNDYFGYFAQRGWRVHQTISTWDQSTKIKRWPKVGFLGPLFRWLVPKKKIRARFENAGYVIFERSSGVKTETALLQ